MNNELFPALKRLAAGTNGHSRGFVVRSVFEDACRYMKSGTLLRQVINKLNESIDFNDSQSAQLAGMAVECPHCHKQFRMPAERSPEPPFAASETVVVTSRPLRQSRRTTHRAKSPGSLLTFLDFKFEHYLIPWIVQATWIVVLLLTFMWIATLFLGTVWAILPETSHAQTPRHTGGGFQHFGWPDTNRSGQPESDWVLPRILPVMGYVTAVAGALVGTLWIRVVLEIVIVVFNIAKTLTSIDDRLKAGTAAPSG